MRADIDMYFEGDTPLPRASYLGYAKVAQVFCGVSADIDQLRTNVSAPLLMASLY